MREVPPFAIITSQEVDHEVGRFVIFIIRAFWLSILLYMSGGNVMYAGKLQGIAEYAIVVLDVLCSLQNCIDV